MTPLISDAHVSYDPSIRAVDLYVFSDGMMVTQCELQPVIEGERLPRSPLQLSETVAQQLADKLYAAGFWPTAARAGHSQLAATEKHLEDMRTIALDQLGIRNG